MARGRHITKYERETIRIGLHFGVPVKQIAAFMGRTEQAIFAHKRQMEESGEINDLPFDFVAEAVADAMKRHGART
ncbi:hypothetical protein G5B38_02395 [Pseudohalocynthiibacter aestuariivivens]|nr:hypothetical protein [Pseudohalocynthiibacter aestuariivivens]QIE44468.1 hypothetical protein G5B38_02395 [Pseudohalocynthiibacter aestuariivivens]